MADFNYPHASRMILLASITGATSSLAFSNGFLLTYLSKFGISNPHILLLLALPASLQFFTIVPFSFLSDHYGKKKLGLIGMYASILGFSLVTVAGWVNSEWIIFVLVIGITIFGLSGSVIDSNWFALLSPIIPEKNRGRFFGKLRLILQSFGIGFSLVVILVLDYDSSLPVYTAILGVMTILLVARVPFYQRIPELESVNPSRKSFKKTLKEVVAIPSYLPFCSYSFLLMLFTGAVPLILGLLEKDVLGFSDDQIILLGNLLLAGSLVGYIAGGKMVDQFGTKYVFLFCHFSFGLILILFLFRDLFPFATGITMGILSSSFGFVFAVSGIAMTSEILYLIPMENKSFSTGLWVMLYYGGVGLSGLVSAQVFELQILNRSWTMVGQDLTHFDALLLICGSMITLMVVTLGLVPSVIGKSQWIPRARGN